MGSINNGSAVGVDVLYLLEFDVLENGKAILGTINYK